MPIIDQSYSTLQNIQTKVRRLTRSPTEASLSTNDLNNYINTFILYDFPQHLRLYNLRTTITFYTQPNVDTYSTESTNPADPLYNFENNVIAIHPTVYLAGVAGLYTQQRDVFYGYYPQFQTIAQQIPVGDGTTGPFNGTLASIPVLQNDVTFSTTDANNTSLILVDYPVSNELGALGLPNQPQTLPSPFGQINYVTGQYTLVFPSNTAPQAPIFATTLPYNPGKPLMILYYDQQFTIRPVPNMTYTVQLECDIRPTALLGSTDIPQIAQWWQYVAYGAAKKVFEDRQDLDSVAQIMPEFNKQEMLVQRASLTVQANERTITIYTVGKQWGDGWSWFGNIGWPY